jgi:hypothetical protein
LVLMRLLLELLRLHVHAMLRLLLRALVVIELLLVAHAGGIHGLLAMVLKLLLLLLLLVVVLVLRLRHLLLHLRREVRPSRVAVHLLLLLMMMLIEVMLLLLLLLLFIVA